MVAQLARDYEGQVQFVTSPGQDSEPAMQKFLIEFGWPKSMVHAVDRNGELWQHFGVRYRGAWIFVDQDGEVQFQSVTHISEKEARANLDRLVASQR